MRDIVGAMNRADARVADRVGPQLDELGRAIEAIVLACGPAAA